MNPYISAERKLPEITIKVLFLALLLSAILAIANAYLALKIGMLTSASIPAAILSMGILKFFKQSNILENNLVQTAASAGEAVAGGIVFTIPALVIIHYWLGFSYWENFFIALTGGGLGIIFSIPLRKILVEQPQLKFPEGKAIAEVLKMGDANTMSLISLLSGAGAGALIEFLQTGIQLFASKIQLWFKGGKAIFGFSAGFSATMIGAGYLIGFDIGLSLFIGAIIGWLIGIPVLSEMSTNVSLHNLANLSIINILTPKIRYIGIGAMLVAGIWTLVSLFSPLYQSIKNSLKIFQSSFPIPPIRTEQDLPLNWVIFLGLGLLLITVFLFIFLFPTKLMGLSPFSKYAFLSSSILIVLIVGFIFSAITGYFSGLVGVSASPGSSIVIAGLLIAGIIIHAFMGFGEHSQQALKAGAAVAIIIGAILTGIACIANDNIQDLKVGHLVGATPWRQQIMLLLGALVAALVIPLIMQLLFNVYGIADVVPRANMPLSQTLPAPPAAAMAAITQGIFQGNLPWHLLLLGGGIMIGIIIINNFLKPIYSKLSILSVAIGIYLPLSTTTPLFLGSLFALAVKKRICYSEKITTVAENHPRNQRGLLLACGLVAGSALMDVVLAIPFALAQNPNVLKIGFLNWHWPAEMLSMLTALILGGWFYYLAKPRHSIS